MVLYLVMDGICRVFDVDASMIARSHPESFKISRNEMFGGNSNYSDSAIFDFEVFTISIE